MSKLGVLAGLGAAGLTYMGLDAAGCIDPVFDYIRTSPGSASEIKLFFDGVFTLTGLTGAIGTVGELSRKVGNALAGNNKSKAAKCLEGTVDSGLAFAMLNNDAPRQFVRDNLLYKWEMYTANVENGLETIAGLSTLAFTVALAYTMFKGSVDKIEDSKE